MMEPVDSITYNTGLDDLTIVVYKTDDDFYIVTREGEEDGEETLSFVTLTAAIVAMYEWAYEDCKHP